MSGKKIKRYDEVGLFGVLGEGEESTVLNLSDIPHPNHRGSDWLKKNTRIVYLKTTSSSDGCLKIIRVLTGKVLSICGEDCGRSYSGKVLLHFDQVFDLYAPGDKNNIFRVSCDINSPFLMKEEELCYLIKNDFLSEWFESYFTVQCADIIEKAITLEFSHVFRK